MVQQAFKLRTQRLAGRENAFSRWPARVVHALVGQAVRRVVGNERRQADIRVVSGRTRGRMRGDACGGVEVTSVEV